MQVERLPLPRKPGNCPAPATTHSALGTQQAATSASQLSFIASPWCNHLRMTETQRAPAVAASVGALIERLARQSPNAPFVIDPETGETITFVELRNRVVTLAAHLQRLGLMRGDRVCVAMDNGVAAVVSHLGAMSGGFVAVPIDPGGGALQLGRIVRHCEPRAVLVADDRRTQIESIATEIDPRIVHVDVGASASAAEAAEMSPEDRPDDDALLMYTSGSTGRPKGVLLSHADVMSRAADFAAIHELGAADRLLCVLPLYHMNAQNMMLGVLYSGSSMVVPRRFSVARYWEWVVRYRCTWMSMAPTIVTQLLRWHETHGGPPAGDLRHVRFARCSSAPLSDSAHGSFEERFGIVLVQGMGMTEAGSIFLNPPHREQRKIGSLGCARNLEVKVVGVDGQGLGSGHVGELMVRGPGVMRGYYKDPEATASAFDATGWLRTGDLGYRDFAGYFFHAGRVKELIIKGGTNVAPAEIDEALASHPDVARAAAVGVPDPHLGEDIGAFVVLRDGARCNEQGLLDHCAAQVGEFKTPSWIKFVDSLPTGPTGKVQRVQLAKSAASRLGADSDERSESAAHESGFIPPQTTVERAIAAAWTEILGCQSPSIHDDFFALGGTSLFALRVTARLRQALGVQLSLGAILGAPTIAAQAKIVSERQRGVTAGDATGGAGDAEGALAIRLPSVGEGRDGVPLFCLYDYARFTRLAPLLGAQHPVYGVSIGPVIAAVGGNQPISTFSTYSIEELARVCVREIRRVQPNGPYQLAGFSFAGRLAFEVAQQLQVVGEEVHLLAIFDTFMPGALRRRPLRWVARHLLAALRRGPRYIGTMARRRWARYRGRLDETTLMSDEADARAVMGYRESAFRRSLGTRYRPRPYSGHVVLFRAAVNQIASHYQIDPQLGWQHIARGKLSVHDVPSDHLGILDERCAPIVADALRRYLKV
jgi:long-chain acyl-CoA synthetase